MTDATNDIFPNWEVRICENGREVALIGLFDDSDNQMDIGMGIADEISRASLAEVLKIAAIAIESETNWYDFNGLVLNPEVTDRIKKGEIS